MNKQYGYVNIDFTGIFIALFVVGSIFGVGVAYGVPWLWRLVKPLIHSVTG